MLSGFVAYPDRGAHAVNLEWFTSAEVNHRGFHVYRSHRIDGQYQRLTENLVRGRSSYSYVDRAVRPGKTYFYKIGAVEHSGHEDLFGPVEVRTPVWGIRTELAANQPNPFVERTQIAFTLQQEARATISIYDVAGRLVSTLVDRELPAGDHSFWWTERPVAGVRSRPGCTSTAWRRGSSRRPAR